MRSTRVKLLAVACIIGGLWAFFERPLAAESPADVAAAGHGAWTLEEALAHLKLYPRDAYVQYVALQLARREGKIEEVAGQVAQRTRLGMRNPAGRTGQIDMFSIFSGTLAVQESLQLDAMRDDVPPAAANGGAAGRVGPGPIGGRAARVQAAKPNNEVPIASLEGPTIKSHPWDKMLAGRTPEISKLARSVPDDFYFASFRSVDKLIEASDLASLWGARMLNQSVQDAETQLVNQRLREQLAVEVSPALRPLYDAFVNEAAIVGSDLFVREGSDVTILFHVKQLAPFQTQMNDFLARAHKSRPDARRSKGKVLGVDFVHVSTPDRQIHVFSAYPTPELHVRSNSRVALERIVAAIQGRDAAGRAVVTLGDTTEFAYIRTLLPSGADEEDGLIYFSDPFIRHLVGPKLRLTERRRLDCYNHLRMIGHAALLYRTEHGKNAESLHDLFAADCCPGEFGTGRFVCPQGGDYSLAAHGLTGVCSHHGYASYMTPCCENDVTHVSQGEADAYAAFLEGYNNYWRTYFDPIAIRLRITPERYRAETIVLPLINNSVYQGLASVLGGTPEPLDSLPVPSENIFSFAIRFDKRAILQQAGMEHLLDHEPIEQDSKRSVSISKDTMQAIDNLRQIALAMHNYEAAHRKLPAPATVDKQGNRLLSWRVELLPYLGEQELYSRFHLDESWDSPHNKALLSRIPAVYRSRNSDLAAQGKTKFVTPVGDDTALGRGGRSTTMKQITDGMSQTIAFVEVENALAVPWTKPDDWQVNRERPIEGLEVRRPAIVLAAFADGAVHAVLRENSQADLAALMTRSGGERSGWRQFDRVPPLTPHQTVAGFSRPEFERLSIGPLLAKGIGNQVAFHVCDAAPMFDLSLSRLMGMSFRSFGGGARFDDDFFSIGMLVAALNLPVYISIPVRDSEIVDGFLAKLDAYLAEQAQQEAWNFFFQIDHDFYELQMDEQHAVRSYGVRFGPLKWRFFWSRVGDAVYLTSTPELMRTLLALESAAEPQTSDKLQTTTAHAMVRLRPEHWQRILPHFQLGWAENNREACLRNLGPLGSLRRALAANVNGTKQEVAEEILQQYAARLHDVRYFCPDDGRYVAGEDGHLTCSCHGSAAQPVQEPTPAEGSKIGQVLSELSDVTITLTFLEDGLHAVATLNRAAAKDHADGH